MQGPANAVEEDELLSRDWPMASLFEESPLVHGLLCAPRHHHAHLPVPIWGDDYDDLDDDAYLEDDLDEDLGYGQDYGHGYGQDYGQDYGHGHVAYDGYRAYDEYDDDNMEDDYEELGTPRLSPPQLSPRSKLRGPHDSWHPEEPGSSPLAGFNALQLADVPAPASNIYGGLHHTYPEDDLDYDLEAPLEDHYDHNMHGHPVDHLDDDLDPPPTHSLGLEFADGLKDPLGTHHDLGVGYHSDRDGDEDVHCQRGLRIVPDGGFESDLDDDLDGKRYGDTGGYLDPSSIRDRHQGPGSERRHTLNRDLAAAHGDRLDYDGGSDLVDGLDGPYGGQLSGPPDQGTVGWAPHHPGEPLMCALADKWEDEDLKEEPMPSTGNTEAAASPMALDYQSLLPGRDDELESAFDDLESLDELDDPPEPSHFSDSPTPFTLEEVLEDDLGLHLGTAKDRMGLENHMTLDHPPSRTPPMSISQPETRGQPMSLEAELNAPDDLELDVWVDDLDDDGARALPFHNLHVETECQYELDEPFDGYDGFGSQLPERAMLQDERRGFEYDEYTQREDEGWRENGEYDDYEYQHEEDEYPHRCSEHAKIQGEDAYRVGALDQQDAHAYQAQGGWVPPGANQFQPEVAEADLDDELGRMPVPMGTPTAHYHDPWGYREPGDEDGFDDLDDLDEGVEHAQLPPHPARPTHPDHQHPEYRPDVGGEVYGDLIDDFDDLD